MKRAIFQYYLLIKRIILIYFIFFKINKTKNIIRIIYLFIKKSISFLIISFILIILVFYLYDYCYYFFYYYNYINDIMKIENYEFSSQDIIYNKYNLLDFFNIKSNVHYSSYFIRNEYLNTNFTFKSLNYLNFRENQYCDDYEFLLNHANKLLEIKELNEQSLQLVSKSIK